MGSDCCRPGNWFIKTLRFYGNLPAVKLLYYCMENATKKTLVIGASANPERYSYLAINRLRQAQHPVVAIGSRPATVAGVAVDTEQKPFTEIDTITLYLNPARQREYYDYILSLHPRRVIFNPGAENAELSELLRNQSIEPVEACTLVLLSTGQY